MSGSDAPYRADGPFCHRAAMDQWRNRLPVITSEEAQKIWHAQRGEHCDGGARVFPWIVEGKETGQK